MFRIHSLTILSISFHIEEGKNGIEQYDQTKAIAAEAWSQLMHSIVSDCPPSDMSRKYYYARPFTIEFLQMQLKHHIDDLQLGPENFQPRRTLESMMMEVKNTKYRQKIQHFWQKKSEGNYLQSGIFNML